MTLTASRLSRPSELTFANDIDHRRIDVDAWDDVYVVGDVHGCRDALERLLAKLDPSDDDLVLFVGDLVRKGPDSRGVVEMVRDRENFLSIRGNNEEKLLRGTKELDELDDEHLAYIESLPAVVSWDDGVVVHGGIDPRKPLPDHDVDDLQNTRSLVPDKSYEGPFWYQEYEGRRAFFGHTVMADPVECETAIGLDTGCVYGGTLTAYDLHADDYVTVPGPQPGVDRDPAKILDPPEGYGVDR